MIAYRLRNRVDIQEINYTIDSESGARSETWVNYRSNVPASVSSVTGKEYIASQSTQAAVNSKIMMRYDVNVRPAMRIDFNGVLYNIKAVLPDSLYRYMTLLCETGVNDG